MPRRRPTRGASSVALAAASTMALGACTMGHDTGSSASSQGSSSHSTTSSSSPTSADLTAQQAFTKTQSSVRSATSANVEVHGLIEHEQSTLTVAGDLDNDPTKTHAAMGANGTADITIIGQNVYVKGDSTYWKKAADATSTEANRLSGKWLKGSKKSFGSDLDGLTPKSFTSEVTDPNGDIASKFQSSSATLKKSTLNGQAVYELTGDDGKTKVWCSADDKYTLLQIDQPDNPEDFSQAVFSNWNAKNTITAPKGAVELPDSGGSGGSSGSGSDGGTTT